MYENDCDYPTKETKTIILKRLTVKKYDHSTYTQNKQLQKKVV